MSIRKIVDDLLFSYKPHQAGVRTAVAPKITGQTKTDTLYNASRLYTGTEGYGEMNALLRDPEKFLSSPDAKTMASNILWDKEILNPTTEYGKQYQQLQETISTYKDDPDITSQLQRTQEQLKDNYLEGMSPNTFKKALIEKLGGNAIAIDETFSKLGVPYDPNKSLYDYVPDNISQDPRLLGYVPKESVEDGMFHRGMQFKTPEDRANFLSQLSYLEEKNLPTNQITSATTDEYWADWFATPTSGNYPVRMQIDTTKSTVQPYWSLHQAENEWLYPSGTVFKREATGKVSHAYEGQHPTINVTVSAHKPSEPNSDSLKQLFNNAKTRQQTINQAQQQMR